jgi:MYXO-CTERM domain-containing protein
MLRRVVTALVLSTSATLALAPIAAAETTGPPPDVTLYITAPADNAEFDAPATIEVYASAFDGTSEFVESVGLTVDGAPHPTTCAVQGQCIFSDIVLEEGIHTIVAVATTNVGTANDSITVYVGVPAPDPTGETTGDTDATTGDTGDTSGDTDATAGDTDATAGDTDATAGDTDTSEMINPVKEGCSCATTQDRPLTAFALLLGLLGLRRRRR